MLVLLIVYNEKNSDERAFIKILRFIQTLSEVADKQQIGQHEHTIRVSGRPKCGLWSHSFTVHILRRVLATCGLLAVRLG
jgi:hypothetical protein